MEPTDDKTPPERPAPATPGNTGVELQPGNTAARSAAVTPDWMGLLGRLTAIESRVGQLEGRNGNLADQIGGLHTLVADHHTILGQHEEQLDEQLRLLGDIHLKVVGAGGPKPMQGRDDVRQLPSSTTEGMQIGATTLTDKGRETELLVDPTKKGKHVVQLPTGGEVEINVKDPRSAQRPHVIRDGRSTSGGGTRRG